MASIEQGRRFPPRPFIERSEDVLDAFGTIAGAAKHLSRQPGLASWFRQWARLEAEALSLYTYECRLVPGLLQTEAYARTLFINQLPPLGDDQIEAQWQASLRNVEVQVMPVVRESHAGLDGPLQLLETPENRWFGYCEGQESGQFISDSKVVSMLQMRYARMRSQALSLEDSLGLLQRMRGSRRSGRATRSRSPLRTRSRRPLPSPHLAD